MCISCVGEAGLLEAKTYIEDSLKFDRELAKPEPDYIPAPDRSRNPKILAIAAGGRESLDIDREGEKERGEYVCEREREYVRIVIACSKSDLLSLFFAGRWRLSVRASDVTDVGEVARAVERAELEQGPIWLLIPCAGNALTGYFANLSFDSFRLETSGCLLVHNR